MIYEICGRTEQGPVRERNEDHILIGSWIRNRGWMALTLSADDEQIERTGLLLAVADGMGGNAGGAEASRIALESLGASLLRTIPPNGSADIRAEDLEAAMRQTNDAVRAAQAQDPRLANMGTTLSGVLLTAAGYWVLHVGDTRVLRVRGRYLRPLTRDDNLEQQLYGAGVSLEVAAANPEAGALVNWVGAPEIRVTVQRGPELEAGDHLVICSDGLHGVTEEDRIIAAFDDPHAPVRQVTDTFVGGAITAGSTDNVSLILVAGGGGG